MKLSRSFIYSNFEKDLRERYGGPKASAIWQYAEDELLRIEKAENEKNSTMKDFLFPAVALYRAVEHYAPGDGLNVTRAYGTKFGLKARKIFAGVTAIPGIPTLMWKNMDKIAGKMSSGYDCENVVVSKNECSLDVVRCPLYDRAKELGTPEAAQMICCMDKEYMTGFRGIDYKRTKSVAEGDECCDYRLRDSRQTKKD